MTHILRLYAVLLEKGIKTLKNELVKKWMTPNVVFIAPDTRLSEAHRLMSEKNIRRLPVVQKGQLLVGIVTRSDVRGAEPSGATSLSIWEVSYLLANLRIEEIMTRNPVTVSAETTISEAARIMMEKKIGGLPVVDDTGRLAGIITESDIFRLVVQTWHG